MHSITVCFWQTSCMLCEVDIICISVTEKLPFFFKRAPINGVTTSFQVSWLASLFVSVYCISHCVGHWQRSGVWGIICLSTQGLHHEALHYCQRCLFDGKLQRKGWCSYIWFCELQHDETFRSEILKAVSLSECHRLKCSWEGQWSIMCG